MLDQGGEVDVGPVERDRAGRILCLEQQVLDEVQEPHRVAVDDVEPVDVRSPEVGLDCLVEQQLEIAADRGERRAQLVRDECDELVLHPVELAKAVVLAPSLAKQLVAVLLGRLGGRDVDREALGVPRLSRRVADDRIAVAQPDDPAVARHEAVLQLERLAALASSALSFAHALSICRMKMVGEEVRECPPLVDRVPEDLVDLRADVGSRPVRARGRVDVRDQRQLFDERAVAALDGVGAALLAEPVGEVRRERRSDRRRHRDREVAGQRAEREPRHRDERVDDDCAPGANGAGVGADWPHPSRHRPLRGAVGAPFG